MARVAVDQPAPPRWRCLCHPVTSSEQRVGIEHTDAVISATAPNRLLPALELAARAALPLLRRHRTGPKLAGGEQAGAVEAAAARRTCGAASGTTDRACALVLLVLLVPGCGAQLAALAAQAGVGAAVMLSKGAERATEGMRLAVARAALLMERPDAEGALAVLFREATFAAALGCSVAHSAVAGVPAFQQTTVARSAKAVAVCPAAAAARARAR